MRVTPIQVILILAIVAILIGIARKALKRDITIREFFLIALFWLFSLAVVLWPNATNSAAHLLGIGRGTDLIVYFATLSIAYAVFRIFIRLEKVERDITELVRRIALKNAEEKEKKEKL
ncbi:MAG: hypothetical protein UW24_C0014G0005 [Parcubacteria group bacterium GW2011_GWA2_44_12]|nr:MAG: hypothetical protein UW24_C0014G0005 [Parcubacteria group bacterium GW2011_GWA2_44_12]